MTEQGGNHFNPREIGMRCWGEILHSEFGSRGPVAAPGLELPQGRLGMGLGAPGPGEGSLPGQEGNKRGFELSNLNPDHSMVL